MKYKFSQQSLDRLKGVHPDLVRVVHTVMDMQVMDFAVAEGLRTPERQEQLLKEKATQTLKSRHLRQPDGFGHAVDLYPSPIDMGAVRAGNAKEISRFGLLAGLMLAAGKAEGIAITWGGDFDRDGQTLDNSFFDAMHFQLEKE
jgi:peptidoglycan L-alanyl-D-glutamate endopeptidase CwlK